MIIAGNIDDDAYPRRLEARVALQLGEAAHDGLSPEGRTELAKMLAEDHELRRNVGDAGVRAVTAVIESATPSLLVREVMRETLREQMNMLEYETSPPLERLLILEVAVCYVQLNCARASYETAKARPQTVKEGMFWEHRLTAAQRRYLRACEALAKIRKLNLTIQINVATDGGQQVNLA